MRKYRERIATSLSRFLWLLAIAACEPSSEPTSLEGPISCGMTSCVTGQVCVHTGTNVDGGIIGETLSYCAPVPTGCVVRDCSDPGCPSCIEALCSSPGFHISERYLSCPAS
jgi:hypothetical protein